MGEALSWILAIVALLLCGAAALAILTIVQLVITVRLGWPKAVPFFADHSLREFPDVVDGMRMLDDHHDDDVIVVAREYARDVVGALPGLGLTCPIVVVPESLYHRYNVRVMPFLVIVDPDGKVQASTRYWRIPGSIASAVAQVAVAMALFMAGCAKLPGRSAAAFAETIRVSLRRPCVATAPSPPTRPGSRSPRSRSAWRCCPRDHQRQHDEPRKNAPQAGEPGDRRRLRT